MKPMTPQQFAQHMAEATRKAGYTVEKIDGLAIHLILNNAPFRAKLDTAYSAYQRSPHRLKDIEAAHLSVLKKVPPPLPPLTARQAEEALLPLLQQTSWVAKTTAEGAAPLYYRPFVTGIVIAYVFDFPDSRAYLNQQTADELLRNSHESADVLHGIALKNLRLRVAKHNVMTFGSFSETLISCETQDGYAATSILLPELMHSWKKKIAGRMLIGIPNRDFILAFSDRHPKGIEGIAEQVRRDASERQSPLLSRLLVWEDGKVREHMPLN